MSTLVQMNREIEENKKRIAAIEKRKESQATSEPAKIQNPKAEAKKKGS